jgi:hypothetical protein
MWSTINKPHILINSKKPLEVSLCVSLIACSNVGIQITDVDKLLKMSTYFM